MLPCGFATERDRMTCKGIHETSCVGWASGSPVRCTVQRYILIVLDGCGVGAMPDASSYGADDPVSDTLGHVARHVGGLSLPHLISLGLGRLVDLDSEPLAQDPHSAWGRCAVRNAGKDSVTGHWEMMGIPLEHPFPVWPEGVPQEWLTRAGDASGVQFLGGQPASGTAILDLLGEEHLRTGDPIAYTSADSVFQIAAHETRFGLERLYRVCEAVRSVVPACRVIARPFVGERAGTFQRTGNRRDWPLAPPPQNLLQLLSDNGMRTHFIGRPGEFFPKLPGQTRENTTSNPEHADALARLMGGSGPGADARFVFVNFEDFDMLCGHRNDPIGFARLLVEFDTFLGEILLPSLRPGDRLGITADHGNDPTTPSTDHSREFVPVLLVDEPRHRGRSLGTRSTLADWAADIAGHLDVDGWSGPGTSFD
jgi:phosphopentomutase